MGESIRSQRNKKQPAESDQSAVLYWVKNLLIESCSVVLHVSNFHHYWEEHSDSSVAHLHLSVLSVLLSEESTL